MDETTDTRKQKPLGTEHKTVTPNMRQAEFAALLDTNDKCLAFLISKRWSDGVRCPRCGNEKVHKLSKPWKWQCKKCAKNGYRFSPLVGTIFENTNVTLDVWFKVIFLMCHSKKGISALQIYRMIGGKDADKKGSYRTAWYMCMRIRAAMKDPNFRKLMGVVEVDEIYLGGKKKNQHKSKRIAGRGPTGKVSVVGAIARKGNVIAQVAERMDADTLRGFVKNVVSKKVELVATDDNAAYKSLPEDGYKHDFVSHRQDEYVRGVVHTANIDNFWSMLKRGVIGTYHNVSKKYLPFYLNEFSYRYNNRKNPDIFQEVVSLA